MTQPAACDKSEAYSQIYNPSAGFADSSLCTREPKISNRSRLHPGAEALQKHIFAFSQSTETKQKILYFPTLEIKSNRPCTFKPPLCKGRWRGAAATEGLFLLKFFLQFPIPQILRHFDCFFRPLALKPAFPWF